MSGRPRRKVPKGYAVDLLRRPKDKWSISVTLINHVALCFYICFFIFLPFNIQEASSGSKDEDEEEEEVLDEETLRRDQVVKGALDVLIREYASELNAPSQDPDSQPRNKKRKEKKEEVHNLSVLLFVAHLWNCWVLSVFFFCLSLLCARRISMPWRWRMTKET